MEIKKSSINSAEKTVHPHAKKYRSYTSNRILLKTDERQKSKMQMVKILKDHIIIKARFSHLATLFKLSKELGSREITPKKDDLRKNSKSK